MRQTNMSMAQDRKTPDQMTDREIAEETLVLLRAFADALEAAASNPMVRAMMPGTNGAAKTVRASQGKQ